MTSNEIIAAYEEGLFSKMETLSRLTNVAADQGVELTLGEMPQPWRDDLEQWIFGQYDNDLDSNQFVAIGDPCPDLIQRRVAIGVLRDWIKHARSSVR
mgnify:CR=1 FL=1